MLIEESLWVKDLLSNISFEQKSPLINIGSQSLEFRTNIQPYIYKNIFQPLEFNNVKIFHVDIKAAEGWILSGISKGRFQKKIKALKPRLILCSNVLEHVEDVNIFCNALADLASNDCFLLVTVPFKYPKHNDPIDNLFRPSPSKLLKKFENFNCISKAIIKKNKKYNLKKFLILFIRLLLPFYKFENWLTCVDKFFYIFREESITCLLIKK